MRLLDGALLMTGIAFEVAATAWLKASDGLTRLWPVVGVCGGYLISFGLMAYVIQRLPVGPVYAAWAGVGTVGAALVGYAVFGDRLHAAAWLGIALVAIGVFLLGLYAPSSR